MRRASTAAHRPPGRARALLPLLLLAAAACGPPPAPRVAPDVAPPDVSAQEPLPPIVSRLVPRYAPVPPRPWLGARVATSPESPREGRVLAVRLRTPPAGREPLAVTGRFGGDIPVRFGRTADGGWLGLAPLGVGSAGRHELVVRAAVSPGDTATIRRSVRVRDHTFPATRLSVAPRYSDPPPDVQERIEREGKMIAEALSTVTEEWLWEGRFTWPRPHRVTSPFGQRRIFNDELRSRHWGLDLAGRSGAPVRAAARGRVALAHHLYFAGNTVFLDHGHGVFTGYSHLSRIDVGVGDTVESGQVLGRVGATGRVTGPHLHWTLRVAGVRLDAASLMEIEAF